MDVGNTIDGRDSFGTREVDIDFAADPHWFPGESEPPVYPRQGFTVQASVPDSGPGYADPFTTNNGFDQTTQVLSPGDLGIAKSHGDPLTVSDSVEYPLKLTNIAQAATLPERVAPGLAARGRSTTRSRSRTRSRKGSCSPTGRPR